MTIQLNIEYETLLELVDQLSDEKRAELMEYLLQKSKSQSLTIAEKKVIWESMVVDVGGILPGYSDRREDMYDNDGR